MNDLLERSTAIEAAGEARAYPPARPAKKSRARAGVILAAIGIYAILICLCVYFITDSLTVGARTVTDAFDAAKDIAASERYQSFYDRSFEKAEKEHHVSNRAAITLGNLRREQKLEVLQVQNVIYQEGYYEGSNTKKAPDSLLEVPGKGIFTVNLKAAEYIIDDEMQYVLIRVPKPELGEFKLEEDGITFIKELEDKKNVQDGIKLTQNQYKDAELNMKREMLHSQELYKRAETSAEAILENLVRQLNPNVPELEVEIEFFS